MSPISVRGCNVHSEMVYGFVLRHQVGLRAVAKNKNKFKNNKIVEVVITKEKKIETWRKKIKAKQSTTGVGDTVRAAEREGGARRGAVRGTAVRGAAPGARRGPAARSGAERKRCGSGAGAVRCDAMPERCGGVAVPD